MSVRRWYLRRSGKAPQQLLFDQVLSGIQMGLNIDDQICRFQLVSHSWTDIKILSHVKTISQSVL